MAGEMTFYEQFIKGTCTKMCPESEIKMREREGLLHKFEILPESYKQGSHKADHKKVVKKYSRCAAGQRSPKPNELRTPNALKNTISYLIEEIVTSKETDWNVVYDFVFDRLCAVRQDAVIQDLDVQHSIDILQPIVRFLAYSGYRMCEEPLQRYDSAINFHNFTDCLRKLLNLYDHQNSMKSQGTSEEYNSERSEFEAMYQITFVGNAEAICRGLTLEKRLRTPLVNLTIELSCAYFGGNYVRVCKNAKNLPPLLLCIVALQLPKIRRYALLVMSVAFSSHNLYNPLSSLYPLLLFDDEHALLKECQNYGITVKDQNIIFQKGKFNEQSPLVSPGHLKFINDELEKHDLSNLLLKHGSC